MTVAEFKAEPYPNPPAHLSPAAVAIWWHLGPTRCKTVGRQLLLQAALEAWDRAEACRVTIEAEGMVADTKSTGARHAHPLLRVEKEARAQFIRISHELALDYSGGTTR